MANPASVRIIRSTSTGVAKEFLPGELDSRTTLLVRFSTHTAAYARKASPINRTMTYTNWDLFILFLRRGDDTQILCNKYVLV